MQLMFKHMHYALANMQQKDAGMRCFFTLIQCMFNNMH